MQLFCYPSQNGHIADVTCHRWTAFAFKIFQHWRQFIHRFAKVMLQTSILPQTVLQLEKKQTKKNTGFSPFLKLQIPIRGKMLRSARDIPSLHISTCKEYCITPRCHTYFGQSYFFALVSRFLQASCSTCSCRERFPFTASTRLIRLGWNMCTDDEQQPRHISADRLSQEPLHSFRDLPSRKTLDTQ